ncbi:hypothetical protein SDC9_91155 [bioreactor metagenome]|uniref:Uncharacterized protein n=1 Tax=bioreactor metagenome TaxID=1076179 RepID=A0A644ZUP1_9ZZZZ
MQVIEVGLFVNLCFDRFHYKCLLFCRAYVGTVAATGTVHRGYLDSEAIFVERFVAGNPFHSCRCTLLLLFGHKEWTDGSVRANIGTLVTLDTVFLLPFGNMCCNASFFVGGGSRRNGAIFEVEECTYRQVVSFLCIDYIGNIPYPVRCKPVKCRRAELGCDVFPFAGYFNFDNIRSTVNGFVVHLEDFLSFTPI